jgi:hypothetical protein
MCDRFPCITRSIISAPTNFIQSRLQLAIINLTVKILTNSNNLFGDPLYWTIFLLRKCIPSLIKIGCCGSSSIYCFPLSQIKVGSFVLLLLSDVLGVEVFLLTPTTCGGDGAGPCFCAPLPPSPPRFRGALFFLLEPSLDTRKSRWSLSGNFEDYSRDSDRGTDADEDTTRLPPGILILSPWWSNTHQEPRHPTRRCHQTGRGSLARLVRRERTI